MVQGPKVLEWIARRQEERKEDPSGGVSGQGIAVALEVVVAVDTGFGSDIDQLEPVFVDDSDWE